MSTLQPNMEAITIPGAITGSAIIGDLLDRIEEKLSKDCSLRSIDVYSGYRARVSVELQLLNVYPETVNAQVDVGSIDPRQDSQVITLAPEVDGEPDELSLEKPIDQSGFEPQEPRQYISRVRTRRE